jgi:hypothetical protein
MTILDKVFGRAEEINGHNRCPTYLYRWTLIRTRWFKVYLHKFVGDDWSKDLHDHPKHFISIGLWGSYLEETQNDKGRLCRKRFNAPWFRTFHATHMHRITTPWGNCWTLVIVGREVRKWGFWHDGIWYDWKSYVEERGGIADKTKACD